MELVGHDSKSMSAQYTHVGAEALEKGRRRTSRALNATEMLVAIEEGTRSAQTDRMYTVDEIGTDPSMGEIPAPNNVSGYSRPAGLERLFHHQRISSVSTCRKWLSRVASGMSHSV